MALNITTGYRQLVAEAEKEIETVSVNDALALHGSADVVFVDRDRSWSSVVRAASCARRSRRRFPSKWV